MHKVQPDRLLRLLPHVALVAVGLFPNLALAHSLVLTVERAIALALETPRTSAQKEVLHQAQTEVTSASALPNPSVSGEVGMLPLSRRYTVAEPGGPTEVAFGVTYPLDWLLFGKRVAAIGSANAGVSVADAEYADFVRRQLTDTAVAFFAVLEAEELFRLAQEALVDIEQVEAAVSKAVSNGGHPRIELGRVRLERQGILREARAAAIEQSTANAILATLIGKSDENTSWTIQGTLNEPVGKKPLPLANALSIAKNHRPDILLLQRKLAKAADDATFEKRQAFPEAALGLGVAHQFQRAIGAPDVTAWGVSFEVSLPIFDRNQGNRAKAASVIQERTHELNAAMIELRSQVALASQELSMAEANAAEASSTDLELADYVRSSTRESYASGGLTFVELLDAQRAYRETCRANVISRAAYLRALVRYESALGTRVFR